MENLKILIVEDEFIIASNLKMLLEDLGYMPLNPVGTKREAIEMLNSQSIDLAILDINLSGKQEGIEVARFINESIHIPFIFLTSNADKATINEAKQTFPKSYLIKPFTEEDIYSAIEIALASENKNDSLEIEKLSIFKDSLFVKLGNKYYRVDIADIVYFEADGKLMHIYTKSEQKFSIRTSLESLFSQLKTYNFIRIHRSYCINSNFLEVINGDFVVVNKQQVPIGRNYRDDLLVNIKTIS
jgi:DNA-binding LytR/AlgR family response regulator